MGPSCSLAFNGITDFLFSNLRFVPKKTPPASARSRLNLWQNSVLRWVLRPIYLDLFYKNMSKMGLEPTRR